MAVLLQLVENKQLYFPSRWDVITTCPLVGSRQKVGQSRLQEILTSGGHLTVSPQMYINLLFNGKGISFPLLQKTPCTLLHLPLHSPFSSLLPPLLHWEQVAAPSSNASPPSSQPFLLAFSSPLQIQLEEFNAQTTILLSLSSFAREQRRQVSCCFL